MRAWPRLIPVNVEGNNEFYLHGLHRPSHRIHLKVSHTLITTSLSASTTHPLRHVRTRSLKIAQAVDAESAPKW